MVFVLDRRKRPLMPCSEKRARLLLTRGRAVVHRRQPFTIRLKDRQVEESALQPVVLKIDPGFRTTGEALVREERGPEGRTHHALLLCQIRHRGEAVRWRLMQRSEYRRRRRLANLRHRAQRFRNRHRPRGWLAPSLRSRLQNVLRWTDRWVRLASLLSVEVELVRFDAQAMQNPEIAGGAYQHGTLFGYEMREYLFEKWHRRCAYCAAARVPLQVEHIIPRCRGGTDRASNLTLSCRACNEAKGTRTAVEFGHPEVQRQAQSPLRDAAAVNSIRWAMIQGLRDRGLEVSQWTGGRTRWNRTRFGLPKTHALDALCVGDLARVTGGGQPVLVIQAVGRGRRARTLPDASGLPRGYLMRRKRVHGVGSGGSGRGEGAHRQTSRPLCRTCGSACTRAVPSWKRG
jgi:5-methylcytosine-specific restriction endonuclease McrA